MRRWSVFVSTSVEAGYRECFRAEREQACAKVDDAFTRLAKSQQAGVDPAWLVQVTSALLEHTFRKQDRSFWFNRVYHQYKTEAKPETDFRQMQKLLPGEKVLDYGCRSGYLAARLAKGGYKVFTTDVLDYRYEEARRPAFVRMASATDIPYPDDSMDVAVVQAVLHHIDPENLPIVIRRLRAVARHDLIKEDTYGLPDAMEGLAETLQAQPLLRNFVSMPLDAQ